MNDNSETTDEENEMDERIADAQVSLGFYFFRSTQHDLWV